MRKLAIILITSMLFSCGSSEKADYTWSGNSVSGEFLFEGPNTLQGQPGPVVEDIASELNIMAEQISAVYVSSATLSFTQDSLRGNVESALVQWVSDDLELVSVATKSPLTDEAQIPLEVTSEQDILPYLKDPSSTLVVDVNIVGDMDELEAVVDFKLSIEYSN